MRKKTKPNKKNTTGFESCIDVIDSELVKRRPKWTLSSLAWIDWDDVCQIIRVHIWKKWHLYDSTRPLIPWLNSIITNQIRNLIRNYYSNYSRPCLKCAAAFDASSCEIYGEQCGDCPLYAYWQKRKQAASQIKIPVSIENHPQEVSNIFDDSTNLIGQVEAVNIKMKEVLKPVEWRVYKGLFIDNKTEREVAQKLGYITSEKGREPGYKQIKNIRKAIITKVKKCIENGDIDVL